MARRSRELYWTTRALVRTLLPSAVGGNSARVELVTEADLEENFSGTQRWTLSRIVGTLSLSRNADATGNEFAVFCAIAQYNSIEFSNFGANSFQPSANWIENVDQRGTLWTHLWSDFGGTLGRIEVPVDIRAKRKFRGGDNLALILQNSGSGAAGVNDVDYAFNLRCLWAR